MKTLFSLLFVLLCTTPAYAAISDFKAGPVFTDYGTHAPVPGVSIAPTETFNIAFDAVKGAEPGEINRKFDTLARFINMHVANGAKLENIHLAIVVHGSATFDVLSNAAYKQIKGVDNANTPLLQALLSKGVRVLVCGQSATAKDISANMLEKGVEVELSAMTAHAHLQQQGYTLNP
ncbi:DsrE family protein [Alteromonas sp. C1M14]|uniref:DsrE family protein n=1 Tax=Alteromonas sp. C1M14 TaxID=2841567 RepID=UPI001C0912C9|nr:DsrE family protein [Alteromonas sp. C1M14]MBU2978090.1 DsrE family protein [Alteromonas sp. C1M14]